MNWKSIGKLQGQRDRRARREIKVQRESPGNKERSARKAIQAPPVRRASRP